MTVFMGKQGNETATHKYYIEKHMEKELVLCLTEHCPKQEKKKKKWFLPRASLTIYHIGHGAPFRKVAEVIRGV